MSLPENTIDVNVVVEMTPSALEAIVENAKRLSSRNEKGHYKIDTADIVGQTISRFLLACDFETFAKDITNFKI
jgi:hypothetical protein